MKPLFFSVIIPTYNRSNFLKHAIDSVLQQSFQDFELIIVDDGSTDGTEELVGELKDSRLVYHHQSNQGVAQARNQGVQLAKGGWIAFLDSDDRWTPKKLEAAVQYIQQWPLINIFHTEEVWYRSGKLLNQKKKHQNPTGWVYPNILPICCMSMSTLVIKREVFDAIGLFDESFIACEDYDFFLRATHQFEVKLIEQPLTLKVGGRSDQLSSMWGLDRFRIQALVKMLSSGSLSHAEYNLTFHELERKIMIIIQGLRKRGKLAEVDKYQGMLRTFRDSEKMTKEIVGKSVFE